MEIFDYFYLLSFSCALSSRREEAEKSGLRFVIDYFVYCEIYNLIDAITSTQTLPG
jgi:hypothetical protein